MRSAPVVVAILGIGLGLLLAFRHRSTRGKSFPAKVGLGVLAGLGVATILNAAVELAGGPEAADRPGPATVDAARPGPTAAEAEEYVRGQIGGQTPERVEFVRLKPTPAGGFAGEAKVGSMVYDVTVETRGREMRFKAVSQTPTAAEAEDFVREQIRGQAKRPADAVRLRERPGGFEGEAVVGAAVYDVTVDVLGGHQMAWNARLQKDGGTPPNPPPTAPASTGGQPEAPATGSEPEAVYQGRPVSEWEGLLRDRDVEFRRKGVRALREIGPGRPSRP